MRYLPLIFGRGDDLDRHDPELVLAEDVFVGETLDGQAWIAVRGLHTWRNVLGFKRELEGLWIAELDRVMRAGRPRSRS